MSCLETNKVTLNWKAGDDEEIVLNYLDSNQNPIDLSGASIKCQLRTKSTSATVELELTAIGDSTGRIVLEATALQTRSLLQTGIYKQYVFDIEVFDSNSKTKTILDGVIVVSTDITR